jgi:branched-chain amino acid transport system substrate-binding protein
VRLVANALALLVLGASALAQAPPHRERGSAPLDFRGPGREKAEPEVAEVLLGWFGPGDPAHPAFGGYWRGALVAQDAENAGGGHRGKPFRLEPAWSETPWKAGIVDVTRLVHERGAWAILGGVDGTTTHLAVQVALKSHLPLVSPGSTDVTADDANVPWLFSLPPSDDEVAGALAARLRAPPAPGGFAIAAGTDHDAHAALVALRRALSRLRLSAAALVELASDEPDPAGAVGHLLRAKPRTLVVIAPPLLAARLVAAARAAGFDGPVLGGPALGVAAFAEAAGPRAEGVVAPILAGPTFDEGFSRAYAARWGREPDAAAALGHDAVRLTAAAIRRAGLNRARIRDGIRALSPWTGAGGTVRFDPGGRREAAVALGVWRSGRLVSEERAAAR